MAIEKPNFSLWCLYGAMMQNLFLSLLHHWLLWLIDTGQCLGQQTLYLQLNNCMRENMNNAYLSYLIQVEGTHAILVGILLLFTFIFCGIQRHLVSFLVVGHSHEDADQQHSVFWHFLNQQHVLWTLPKIIEAFDAHYWGNGITLAIFPGCWDFKEGL